MNSQHPTRFNPYAASDRRKLGELLKKQREKRNFTQDYITEKTGLTRKQIIAIEKGTTNYRMDTLFRYLKAIDREIAINSDSSS